MINSSITKITFDTNTLNSVLYPDKSQRKNKNEAEIVLEAIKSGKLQGFFSETLVTLEGITRQNRPSTIGSTRAIATSRSIEKNQVEIKLGFQFTPSLMNRQHSERVNDAIYLKIFPLRTGLEMGNFHLDRKIYPLYEPDGGIAELVRCMDEVHRLSACLRCKGVGKEAAIRLGKKLSDKYRTDAEKYDKNGNYKQELFHKGLGRAETKSEVRQVSKVVAEWADGDSVAAHYGFGIDLFCTEDFGRSSDEPSVLDEMHRLWLKSDFGINFVTLCDLAQMLTK